MQKLEISEQNGLFIFDIRADGFLWNMVRKIVGALEKVGSDQKDMSWFADLLRPELNHGAPTAPAEGLILMDVGYEGLDWQVDEYSRARAAKALAGDGAEQDGRGECGEGDGEGDGAVVAKLMSHRIAVCRVSSPAHEAMVGCTIDLFYQLLRRHFLLRLSVCALCLALLTMTTGSLTFLASAMIL